MAATKEDISEWFDRGVKQKATHMLVFYDTFVNDDYPVFANSSSECAVKYRNQGSMQRVVEVYDLRDQKEEQMNERHVMRLPKSLFGPQKRTEVTELMKMEKERSERVAKNLNAAVETMRDSCDEAGRAIAQGDDQNAARRVLHAIAWGFANASSSIECAMYALEDEQNRG